MRVILFLSCLWAAAAAAGCGGCGGDGAEDTGQEADAPFDPQTDPDAIDPDADEVETAEDQPPDVAETDDPTGEDPLEDPAGDEWETPAYPCFSTAPPGDYIGSAGCFDIYASCDPANSSLYLFVKNGTVGNLSFDEISALKDTVEADVMDLPFVNMFGIGLSCCDGTTNAGCWHITLQGNSGVTVMQMAERLGALSALCGSSACLGIAVEIPAPSSPRCGASDPNCDPLPMCDPENCPGGTMPNPGCCPSCRPLDASPRTLSIGSHAGALVGPELEYLEVPVEEEAGECTHDGECVLNGCGQYCCSYDDLTFISTCECYPPLSPAWCGCVEGRCRWFHQ
jgi:hypothetical protein